MKSIIIAFLALMCGITIVKAQPSVTLLTFESYTFSDKFSTEYGEGKIGDGFQWGGGLEFGLKETAAVELIYQTMKTTATYRALSSTPTGSVNVNYAMLGGTKYMPLNDVISGFGSVDAGVGWFNASESLQSANSTKFSIGGRLGLRIQTSEKVSIRLHGQVLSPVQWAGGGFYFGTGGAGTGVSTGSTIWQWNLGGSVNIRVK
jgi:hypothetical protein